MFVRSHGVGAGEQVIVVHVGIDGPVEVVRHLRARPGSPAIDDAHFPDHGEKIPGEYTIKARSAAETGFLGIGIGIGIGTGAHAWLLEAAAAGTARMTVKMAEAVALAKISGLTQVDQALGGAATYGRFATEDLASILGAANHRMASRKADEKTSLAQGTAGWAAIGRSITPVFVVVATDDLKESA